MSGLNPFRKVQLINNFGITDEAVISEAETMFTNLAALQGMPDGNFDCEHLQRVHAHLLGDMYPWAGDFRTAEIQVGNGVAKSVAPAALVSLEVDRILTDLRKVQPSELNRLELADRLASTYSRLYGVSPFPDGNARTARFFLDKYAESHDLQLNWEDVPVDAFKAAEVQAVKGNTAGMRHLFRAVLKPIDLYEQFSADAMSNRVKAVAERVGITAEVAPLSAMIGLSQSQVIAAVHRSINELKADLSAFGQGQPTVRDWASTSIAHEAKSEVKDFAAHSAVLNTTLERLRGISSDSAPGIRSPGTS